MVLEDQVVMSHKSWTDSLVILFGLIYALQLSYPEKLSIFFEFIQVVLLNLYDGRKQLRPKLQALRNELEWSCQQVIWKLFSGLRAKNCFQFCFLCVLKRYCANYLIWTWEFKFDFIVSTMPDCIVFLVFSHWNFIYLIWFIFMWVIFSEFFQNSNLYDSLFTSFIVYNYEH